MIEFAWWWMILLAPLPLLRRRRRTTPDHNFGAAVQVPFLSTLQSLEGLPSPSADRHRSRRWVRVLALLAWLALVLACMRPQWSGEPVLQRERARDLLLAIDISPSMQETDMILQQRQVPRVRVVKQVVAQFLEQRQGDRIGLILFGAQPYVQAPLTHDLATVGQLMDEAQLGMAGNATAIGDAIGLAIKRLRDRPASARVLILLTDGANTGGETSPRQAAEMARDAGIRIHTIGVGAEEMVRRGLFGPQRTNPSADLDEALLTEIAELTGGRYFRARSTGELEMVYESLNQLEPVEQDARYFRPVTEYYWIAALAALVLALPGLWMRGDELA